MNITDYIFNLTNNRYLSAYMYGYVSGKDSNDDTPMVRLRAACFMRVFRN
jgi:hypothetical protein